MVNLSLEAKAQSLPTIAFLRYAVQVCRTRQGKKARFRHSLSLAPHKSSASRDHFRRVCQSLPRAMDVETRHRGNFPRGRGVTSLSPCYFCVSNHNYAKLMVLETRGRGNFRMGRRAVLIGRHNFHGALQNFYRVMAPECSSLGKIRDDAEWTRRAIGDFWWSMGVGCGGESVRIGERIAWLGVRRLGERLHHAAYPWPQAWRKVAGPLLPKRNHNTTSDRDFARRSWM